MNFYLITIVPEQIFFPEGVKNVVTNDSSIDAWWNHVSNTYIIRTNQTAQYHADRILTALPGLSFLIVKIDLNEYNGYLPQIAWDWIRAHSTPKPTYKTLPSSGLLETLRDNRSYTRTSSTPITQDALEAVLRIIKGSSNR